ncbi:MAG: hypothetical protein ACK5LN_12280 [Propioniciclava sp.]
MTSPRPGADPDAQNPPVRAWLAPLERALTLSGMLLAVSAFVMTTSENLKMWMSLIGVTLVVAGFGIRRNFLQRR